MKKDMSSAIVHIRDGKIQNPKTIRRLFDDATDGRYRVELKKSNKRTLLQNAWFHVILPDIVKGLQDAGYSEVKTNDDAKLVIKALFFKKIITNGIEEISVIEGTSETSKENFIERADEIIRWAQEYLGINVSPPNTQFEFFE